MAKTKVNVKEHKVVIDEMYIHRLVGNNVKRFRALQNISQLNLANSAGLTHNFINDIENGKKGISARTLAKLSIALKVEPYQLFLPENILNNEAMSYVKCFNDSLHKFVNELTQQYIGNN